MEIYIGKILVWKHYSHLETWIGYWKHGLGIGNGTFYIGNIENAFEKIFGILETNVLYWKNRDMFWKQYISKHKNAFENNAY